MRVREHGENPRICITAWLLLVSPDLQILPWVLERENTLCVFHCFLVTLVSICYTAMTGQV